MLLLGLKKEENELNLLKNKNMSIEQQAKGGKQGEVRYLTPLDIDTNKEKNTVVLKRTVSNISIIKMQIS